MVIVEIFVIDAPERSGPKRVRHANVELAKDAQRYLPPTDLQNADFGAEYLDDCGFGYQIGLFPNDRDISPVPVARRNLTEYACVRETRLLVRVYDW
jgi:hypothetical protein